jgi:hypothetical protein
MLRRFLASFLPALGLFLVGFPGCIRSVCETKNDCPVGNLCSSGVCIAPCTADPDCPGGKFCDQATGLCATGCRSNSDCANGAVCAQNQCWAISTPAEPADGGQSGDGASSCSCLQAPRACLKDINPASATAEMLVCEPSSPPRATALFFGNLGCSHCQAIFDNLLFIESRLHNEGLDPLLVFVQLKTYSYTGEEVSATFPTHTGPVLQDTSGDDMWGSYGADWYDVKIIDAHGCLSAFFTETDTQRLASGGQLQPSGKLLEDAWRAAMGAECPAMLDAGAGAEVGL